MHFPPRSRYLRLSLLASSLLIAVSAQGRERVNVDLPAAPLGEAINALAQQSSVQIIFASDLGADRATPAMKGQFTAEEALQTLLKGSGLQAQAKGDRTFIVVAQKATASSAQAVTQRAPVEMAQMDITASRTSSSLVSATPSAQVYYRDYFTRFTPFDARAVATRGGNVDQVMQNSEVFGSRLTLRTPLGNSGSTELVWGGDYNQERSDMPLDVFDPAAYDASGGLVFDKTGKLTYMPPLKTRSAGAFAQLQHRFNEHWSIDGGLRYEYSTAKFDDFVPLSESAAASPVAVAGGEIHYDAVLSNFGIVYSPVLGQEVYASFSQGFQLPDVGIQLRNARRGFDIDASNLEPVKTNNYEMGWRGDLGSNTLGTVALFYTTSKLGDVQSFNNGLILTRTQERIYGAEASVDWLTDDAVWGAGGSATWMRGREKPDGCEKLTGGVMPVS